MRDATALAALLYSRPGQLLVPWPGRDGAGPAGLRWVCIFQAELYRMCRESLDCDPKVAEILVAHPDLLGDR